MSNPHDPYAPADPISVEARPAAPVVMDGKTETEEPQTESMPKGSTSEVLAWAGNDKERAQTALDTEKSHANPRKGLVSELEELLAK